jgi:hypothetical protein
MSSNKEESSNPGSPFAAWMESAGQFWTSTAKAWTGASGNAGSGGASMNDSVNRMRAALETSMKVWEALFSSMSRPEAGEAFLKGTSVLPEVALKMMRTGWDGYFHLFQQWLRKVESGGEPGQAFSFENLDQDMFKTWMEYYEKDIQPLLNIPQLGLARFYQERLNQTADRFNQYQAAMSEFLHLLSRPFEKSFRAMEEKLDHMLRGGESSEGFKDYYGMWIKLLEGHYMNLFKSDEFLKSLHRTLAAGQDFKMAQRGVLEDCLQSLPIPTNKDMDELYKEIYLLKKKVKDLSRKLENRESRESRKSQARS